MWKVLKNSAIFYFYLDFVWFNKLRVGIDVGDTLVSQRHPVAPVQWANVVVHCRLHCLPAVVNCAWTKLVKVMKQRKNQVSHSYRTRLAPNLPKQDGPMSPLRDLRGRFCECSPFSSNCQPNFGASCKAVPSSAVWCISFFGMQPTFTHVPPRPRCQIRQRH